MTTFQIGDRVVCPVLPYMGKMTILYVYETQKKLSLWPREAAQPFKELLQFLP